jgi:phage terminase large subunit-like protein
VLHRVDPRREPSILGVDGSINNDTTAMALVTRHPDPSRRDTAVVVRRTRVWYPKDSGGVIDLQEVEDEIRRWCGWYNILQIPYDAYQLHQMMTNILKDAVAWTYSFSQQTGRNVADKALYDLIIRKDIVHDGDSELHKHMMNAATKDTAVAEDKMRIVKKRDDTPVDLVIATAMAAHECLRLNL